MTYVIQQPFSNTNPTGKYTVILLADWFAYIHGTAWKLPVASVHDTYEAAMSAKDKLNAAETGDEKRHAPLAPHGGCNWEGCKECFPRK